ncbi:MAG: glycerate kinase [Gammaproteobacteria bacterium]
MRILIAPDSFKESLPAPAVAAALARGMHAVLPDAVFDLVPMADGGEGTLEALVAATAGTRVDVGVTGPLGERRRACYGLLGGERRTAVVEMAAASGLMLVPANARDPTRTTSYGTGELFAHALGQPVDTLIVAIGGSATVDGGAGLCQALGVRFLDGRGHAITRPLTGGMLSEIAHIDVTGLDPRIAGRRVLVACDVDNPLLGPHGAAAVFGPQKGASPAQVALLDAALAAFCTCVEARLGVTVRDRPGAGAAGGMGAALLAFLGAQLRSGVEIVIDAIGLDARIRAADCVITGEGRLDGQTLHGKAPLGVARLARRLGVPVVGVGGSLAADAEPALAQQFDALEACVTAPTSEADALAAAVGNVERAGGRIAQWLHIARRESHR